MHFCASLLHISVVTELLSFVSAEKFQNHVKLNNEKIRLVAYPELVYTFSVLEIYIKKEKKIIGQFGFSGYTERKIYPSEFQKWPPYPSYGNATKMFRIQGEQS